MSRPRIPLKAVLVALVVVLLGWGLYSSIEFYDETVEARWSFDAMRNPYLAAQQFLEQSEIDVVDADSLVDLDSLDGVGTLFVSEANQVATPRQLRELKGWLEAGGHVIYAASRVGEGDDLLLEELDVSVERRDREGDEDSEEPTLSESMREYNRQIEEGKTREEIADALAGQNSLTRVDFGDEIGALEIEFDDSKSLVHPYIEGEGYDASKPEPSNWAFSDYGVQLMQFEVGGGLLTLVSDPTVWISYYIDQHDHAYLLWLLAAPEGSFAILRPVLKDSIWTLLWNNATELLIASAALLALWLWHQGARFGRILPRDTSRQRALGEHFSSISHYLWHRRDGEYLITPLRQRVLRRASLVLGEFSGADAGRQAELLAERCDLNPDAVARALANNDFNETTFVQKVRLLKRIEQSL